ncbi:hypothetical protein V1506DRAFT_48237 [Lipomyces tetrasporus]
MTLSQIGVFSSNPFGPLKVENDTCFGRVATVGLVTNRLQNRTTRKILTSTLLPFSMEDFVGGEVPTNLAEITPGDCISPHI